MNRKLVNALLLVALATGSCSMFTSCKDTDDDFYTKVISNQVELETQLTEAKNKLIELENKFNNYYTKDQIDNEKVKPLQDQIDYLNNVVIPALEQKYDAYEGRIAALEGADNASSEDLNNLKEELEKEITALTNKINGLEQYYRLWMGGVDDRFNQLITDINLNQTWNPMFGSINLPVGLSTTIAANYYGKADHALVFPSFDETGAKYEINHEDSGLGAIPESFVPGATTEIKANQIYMNEFENQGNLGHLYLSINPTDIDKDQVKSWSLVSSDGVEAPVALTVNDCDEKLMFGVTRDGEAAKTGFYRAEAAVAPADAEAISIKIEDGLKETMKSALKNHTKSDLVALAKVLMDQMQDIMPAYAVKAVWETPDTNLETLDAPDFDEEGNIKNLPKDVPTKEVTYVGKYEIAATTFQPLGYSFMQGMGTSKDLLPTVGSLQEAFDNAFDEIANKININIKFDDIKGLDLDGLGITIAIDHISFDNDAPKIVVNLAGIEVKGDKAVGVDQATGNMIYDHNVVIGTVPAGQTITLTYNPNVTPGAPGVAIGDGALNEFMKLMTDKINGMLDNIQGQINNDLIAQVDDLIENQIQKQVNDMLTNINNQLKGINGQIDSQVKSILADIKESLLGKLGRVDSLIDKYNSLANRINDLLKNPNHYLQVAMLYEGNDKGLHHLSANQNFPTVFTVSGSNNALELYATSYTAELIAPSYKKFVAVTNAWKDGVEAPAAVTKANATEFINDVVPGNNQKFALEVEAGYTYQIVYSSLDYRGFTSSRVYYVTVQ